MNMDIFGDDDGEPAPVPITGSPSEHPSNSDNDNSPSNYQVLKAKVQLLRERANAIQHFLKRIE